MSPTTRELVGAIGSCLHRRHPRTRTQCRASGWTIATAATDGHGHTCCPECEQPTDVTGYARRAATIDPHQVPA